MIAKLKYIRMFALTFLFVSNTFAQTTLWENFDPFYRSGGRIAIDGNYIWVGKSEGGVVRFNKVTENNEYYRRYFTPLTSNNIRNVKVDKLGNKWFAMGTWGNTETTGIAKFDGSNWTIYDYTNSSLPDDNIEYLDIDKNNYLWVGTNHNGLFKYDGISWTTYDTSNSLIPSNNVKHVSADTNGNVWFLSATEFLNTKLVKFDGINWKIFYPDSNGFPGNTYTYLMVDKNNIKWMCSYSGLVKYDDIEFKVYTTPGYLVHPTQVAIDVLGNCYVATGTNGLLKLDTMGKWTRYTIGDTAEPQSVRGIAIDEDNIKWLSTFKGLTKFTEVEEKSYPLSNAPLLDVLVTDVFTKDGQTIWFGCWGIAKYDGTNWKRYDYTNSIFPASVVEKIQGDNEDNLWIATNQGLVKLKDTTLTIYTTENSGLPGNIISDIAIDKNNNLWLATGKGVAYLENDSITVFYKDSIFYEVEIDRYNNKWFGGENCGLVKFNDSTWTAYTTSNSPLWSDRIENICIDVYNNIWLAGPKIQKYNGRSWRLFTPSNYLPVSDYSLDIEADSAGNVWMSSIQSGIIKIDRLNNWSLFNNQNSGLIGVNQMVHSIRIDKNGYKYFATNDGGVTIYKGDQILSVDPIKNVQPDEFKLYQNYPNPFNPVTKISWQTSVGSHQTIKVYDMLGREIITLIDEYRPAGSYEIEFDSDGLASGVYYYKLNIGVYNEVKKMLLLK